MPADTARLLKKIEEKSKELIEEIKQYKKSKELNQKATESLEATSKEIENVIKKIKPYQEERMQQFQIILLSMIGANIVLSIGVIVLLVLKF